MYQAPNLRCIFHKTNNSWQGQDVVATPRTTTLIYTLRAQAETDVDDLKITNYRGKIWWEKKFPVGLHLFTMKGLGGMVVRFWLVHFKKFNSMS